MKKIITIFILSFVVSLPVYAQTNAFVNGQIGTIRQDTSSNLVRVNIEGATISESTCANRNFAVVLLNDNANFKNQFAAVLTARALGQPMTFSYDIGTCADATPGGAIFAVSNGTLFSAAN